MNVMYRGRKVGGTPSINQFRDDDLKRIYVDEGLYKNQLIEINSRVDSFMNNEDLDKIGYIESKYDTILEEYITTNTGKLLRRVNSGPWHDIATDIFNITGVVMDEFVEVIFKPEVKKIEIIAYTYIKNGEEIEGYNKYTITKDVSNDIPSELNSKSPYINALSLSSFVKDITVIPVDVNEIVYIAGEYTCTVNKSNQTINIISTCELPVDITFDLSVIEGDYKTGHFTGHTTFVFRTSTGKVYVINPKLDTVITELVLPSKSETIDDTILDYCYNADNGTITIVTERNGIIEYDSWNEKFVSDVRISEDIRRIAIDITNKIRVYGEEKVFEKFHRAMYQEDEMNFIIPWSEVKDIYFYNHQVTKSIEMDNVYYVADTDDNLKSYNPATNTWEVIDTLLLDELDFPNSGGIILDSREAVFNGISKFYTIVDYLPNRQVLISSINMIKWYTEAGVNDIIGPSVDEIIITDYHVNNDRIYVGYQNKHDLYSDYYLCIIKNGSDDVKLDKLIIPQLEYNSIDGIEEDDNGKVYIRIGKRILSSLDDFENFLVEYDGGD